MWNYLFRTVMLCNNSIELLEHHKHLLTDKQRLAYVAEVCAVRALFYYQLLDLFGRIPLVIEAETKAKLMKQSGPCLSLPIRHSHMLIQRYKKRRGILPKANGRQSS